MLKLQIKSDIKPKITPIVYEDFGINLDLSIVSGTCDASYNLKTSDNLFIKSETKQNGFSDVIETEDFSYIGTFSANTTYDVKKIKPKVKDKNVEISYIIFNNGKYYYNQEENPDYIFIPSSVTNLSYEEFKIENDTITVLQKYYITGDTCIGYDGTEYDIYINHFLKEDGTHYTESKIIDSNNQEITDFEIYETAKDKTKFYLKTNKNWKVNVDFVRCSTETLCVEYGDKIYQIDKYTDNGISYFTTDLTMNGNIISGIDIYNSSDNNDIELIQTKSVDYVEPRFIYSDYHHIYKMNDSETSLIRPFASFHDSDYGRYLNVYLSDNFVPCKEHDILIASSKNSKKYRLINNFYNSITNETKIGIFFQDKIYEKKIQDDITNFYHDFAVIGDNEYEIHYTCPISGYIIYDNKQINLIVSNDKNDVIDEYKPIVNDGTYKLVIEEENVDIKTSDGYDSVTSYTQCYKKVHINYNNLDKQTDVYFYSYNDDLTETGNTLYAYRPKDEMNISKNLGEGDINYDFVSQPAYGVHRYEYIEINGNKYNVLKSVDLVSEYTIIEECENYQLEVLNILGNNLLLCSPIVKEEDLLIYTRQHEASSIYLEQVMENICHDIMANHREFTFMIKNENYGHTEELDKFGYLSYQNLDYIDVTNMSFYKIHDYITVPLYANEDIASNSLQGDMLRNEFIPDEEAKAINPIVDMDKDVYYPYVLDNDNKFQEVQKIKFDFHFRTRNLDTWKINEDYKEAYYPNNSLEYYKIFPTFGIERTNWFCTDFYSGNTSDDMTDEEVKIELNKKLGKACVHSDLLYFLNFDSNDVYYQKSRVKKTFIRLLFYDSMNPSTQSLLYQATVWLDANLLYKKYIDNIKDNKPFFYVDAASSGVSINTNAEPFNKKDKEFTFNDDERLMSQFNVSNRYLSRSSAEGFYLHLFKELSEGICEHTIYMKVQLNHAGEGQSCLFTLVRDKDSNVIKNKDFEDNPTDYIPDLQKGLTIARAIKEIYIPLRIKFLETENRFVYIFDEKNVSNWDKENNEVTLNFFEIKLKDESN